MPAVDTRIDEVRMLAGLLWFLPPPARTEIADKLHGLGMRVHPELATLELERLGPRSLGNHAPTRPVKRTVAEAGLDTLRSVPGLAEIADAIEAAGTEQEKAELARTLLARSKQAHAEAGELIDRTQPEDLE